MAFWSRSIFKPCLEAWWKRDAADGTAASERSGVTPLNCQDIRASIPELGYVYYRIFFDGGRFINDLCFWSFHTTTDSAKYTKNGKVILSPDYYHIGQRARRIHRKIIAAEQGQYADATTTSQNPCGIPETDSFLCCKKVAVLWAWPSRDSTDLWPPTLSGSLHTPSLFLNSEQRAWSGSTSTGMHDCFDLINCNRAKSIEHSVSIACTLWNQNASTST